MRVGWLADDPGYVGGAELTAAEFKAACPEGVEVVDCPPGEVKPGLDAYVAHNVVQYKATDLDAIGAEPVTWFHHDLSPWIKPEVRAILDHKARHLFCSPLGLKLYPGSPGDEVSLVPPAIPLDRFYPSRSARRHPKRHRKGACSIAQWRGAGKGARQVAEWAREFGEVDVYGVGDATPRNGKNLRYRGPLDPDEVPAILRRYETFVFLPIEVEPFGRSVVEAWAAGCRLAVNRNIGALYWINENPHGLDDASQRFWEEVVR